jgi:CBS-domain-containing membrane protein
MKASEVMTTRVITVAPSATVREIAGILLDNRISAVPVVDERGVTVGIVSEGDLLHRVEAGTERHRSWWLNLIADRATVARDFLKSHATRAREIMTRPVVSVAPDTPLGEIAEILEKRRIKRVPVIDEGRLVGIVSRANLLQALAARKPVAPAAAPGDAALRERVLGDLRKELADSATHVNVIAVDGTVELWGQVETADEREALRVAAELVPGVRSVVNNVVLNKVFAGV